MILIGLPVLVIFAFGNAPCPDGPCNPDGAANLRTAAVTLVALAILIGGLVWWLVDRRASGESADAPDSSRPIELAAKVLLILAAGVLAYVILG